MPLRVDAGFGSVKLSVIADRLSSPVNRRTGAAIPTPSTPADEACAGSNAGGLLIAFEGGEGAGKTSQLAVLARTLRAAGHPVRETCEPGGTRVGAGIRRLLLGSEEPITPRSEALLFAADRAQHVAVVVRPALDRGEIVLTDRFTDSSLAYQGAGRALAADELRWLSRWAAEGVAPDLTVLLDIDAEVGLSRARSRCRADAEGLNPPNPPNRPKPSDAPDRLEREALSFHRRVRAGFRSLAAADPSRYLVLDAGRPSPELSAEIAAAVLGRLGLPADTGPSSGKGECGAGDQPGVSQA